MIAHNFLQSARLLADGMRSFDEHCARGIEPNRARIGELMEQSLMLVTALAPHIGYDRAAQIAKHAQKEGITLRQAALQSGHVTEQQFNEWIVPIEMTRPDPA
jgi:fumarate hydratase class II